MLQIPRILAISCLVPFLSIAAMAQSSVTIFGTVTDATGAAVPQAAITIEFATLNWPLSML